MSAALTPQQIAALTPVQSWVYRYLTAIDNNGSPAAYQNTTRPRGGVLGSIEYLQTLVAEGVARGFIAAYATPQGTPANPPADADVVAAGWTAGTNALLQAIVYTCQTLNATLAAGNVMAALLSTRQ